jgi:hypothetical protein
LYGIRLGAFRGPLHTGQGSDDDSHESNEQAGNHFEQAALTIGFQLIEHMLDVDTGGDELRSLHGHRSQQSLPAFVDERDRTKIDRACSSVLGSVPLFPACSELADPRLDQTAFDRPPLFRGRFRNRNSQHVDYSHLPPSADDPSNNSLGPYSTADSRTASEFALMRNGSSALAHMNF